MPKNRIYRCEICYDFFVLKFEIFQVKFMILFFSFFVKCEMATINVEQAIKEAIEKFGAFKMPEEGIGEAFEEFKLQWHQLKEMINEQSNEWQVTFIELVNQVATKASNLMREFESVLLEEDNNQSAPMNVDGEQANEPKLVPESEMVIDQVVNNEIEKPSVQNIASNQEPVEQPLSNASTTSAHSSALSNDAEQQVEQQQVEQQQVEQQQVEQQQEPSASVYANKRFNMCILQRMNNFVATLGNLPTIPERAQGQDFANLCREISRALDYIRGANMEVARFAPMIIAQAVNALNRDTRLLWSFELTRGAVDLNGLRHFLRNQEDLLNNGWNPSDQPGTSAGACGGAIPKKFKITTNDAYAKKGSATVNTGCFFCGKEHRLYRCPGFLAHGLQDRISIVRSRGICPNCLKGFHPIEQCEEGYCRKCSTPNRIVKHNSVLCDKHF